MFLHYLSLVEVLYVSFSLLLFSHTKKIKTLFRRFLIYTGTTNSIYNGKIHIFTWDGQVIAVTFTLEGIEPLIKYYFSLFLGFIFRFHSSLRKTSLRLLPSGVLFYKFLFSTFEGYFP